MQRTGTEIPRSTEKEMAPRGTIERLRSRRGLSRHVSDEVARLRGHAYGQEGDGAMDHLTAVICRYQ